MFTIYVYVLDTLADWEIGYVTAELKSGRFFKEDAPSVSVSYTHLQKRRGTIGILSYAFFT